MEYNGIPVHPAVMKVASTGRVYDLATKRWHLDPRRPNALRRGMAYGSFRSACLDLIAVPRGRKIAELVWAKMCPDLPLVSA